MNGGTPVNDGIDLRSRIWSPLTILVLMLGAGLTVACGGGSISLAPTPTLTSTAIFTPTATSTLTVAPPTATPVPPTTTPKPTDTPQPTDTPTPERSPTPTEVLIRGEGTPVANEYGYNARDFPVWTPWGERATARLYYGPGDGSFESYWAGWTPEGPIRITSPRDGINRIGVGEDPFTLYKQSLLPTFQGDIATLGEIPRYRIVVSLDADPLILTGRQQVLYTNKEGSKLGEIHFCLCPKLP